MPRAEEEKYKEKATDNLSVAFLFKLMVRRLD